MKPAKKKSAAGEHDTAFKLASLAAQLYSRDTGIDPSDAVRLAKDLLFHAELAIEEERTPPPTKKVGKSSAPAKTSEIEKDRIKQAVEFVDALDWTTRISFDEGLKTITAACSSRTTAERKKRFQAVFGKERLTFHETSETMSLAEAAKLACDFSEGWSKLKKRKRKRTKQPRAKKKVRSS